MLGARPLPAVATKSSSGSRREGRGQTVGTARPKSEEEGKPGSRRAWRPAARAAGSEVCKGTPRGPSHSRRSDVAEVWWPLPGWRRWPGAPPRAGAERPPLPLWPRLLCLASFCSCRVRLLPAVAAAEPPDSAEDPRTRRRPPPQRGAQEGLWETGCAPESRSGSSRRCCFSRWSSASSMARCSTWNCRPSCAKPRRWRSSTSSTRTHSLPNCKVQGRGRARPTSLRASAGAGKVVLMCSWPCRCHPLTFWHSSTGLLALSVCGEVTSRFSSSWQELSLKSTAPAHGFGGLHTIRDILPKALVKGPAAI